MKAYGERVRQVRYAAEGRAAGCGAAGRGRLRWVGGGAVESFRPVRPESGPALKGRLPTPDRLYLRHIPAYVRHQPGQRPQGSADRVLHTLLRVRPRLVGRGALAFDLAQPTLVICWLTFWSCGPSTWTGDALAASPKIWPIGASEKYGSLAAATFSIAPVRGGEVALLLEELGLLLGGGEPLDQLVRPPSCAWPRAGSRDRAAPVAGACRAAWRCPTCPCPRRRPGP